MTVAERLEVYEISDERLRLLADGLVELRGEDLRGLLAAALRYRERWLAAEEGLRQMGRELSTLVSELHCRMAELQKKENR